MLQCRTPVQNMIDKCSFVLSLLQKGNQFYGSFVRAGFLFYKYFVLIFIINLFNLFPCYLYFNEVNC